MTTTTTDTHPFLSRPNRTLFAFLIPTLFSMIAEPVTGLVDTAFIAQLGAVELAALGVGTTALSSLFWIFNFLGIGAQTEIAQSMGQQKGTDASRTASLALAMSIFFGVFVMVIGIPLASTIAAGLGAEGAVQANATQYMQIRLLGAPAVVLSLAGFGILRGMQDMRTPLYVAVAVNVINIILDAPFIFGFGIIPALGVGGSALATMLSQWIGASLLLIVIVRRLGFNRDLRLSDATNLLKIGGDLFVRTGLLTVFLLLATRTATQISVESGAAHQAIRQIFTFTALLLDAFAITAQSLIGYFWGSGETPTARRVAAFCTRWCFGTGIALAVLMIAFTEPIMGVFVPEAAMLVFVPAWIVSALSQPLNALAFVTDGIHWGTSDFGYLRNAMILSTLIGGAGILLIDISAENAFLLVWIATTVWVVVRAVLGVIRIWPGVGAAPLRDTLVADSQ